MFHDPKVDTQFAEYLKGKSVCIVGRAEYLRDMEQGELIDSYDVVVRLHNPMPYLFEETVRMLESDPTFIQHHSWPEWHWHKSFVSPEMHKVIGSRVNVFYYNVYGIQDKHIGWFKTMVESFKKAGGKFLATDLPANWNHHGSNAPPGFVSDGARDIVISMLHSVTVNDPDFIKLHEITDGDPYSGVSAILDIVKHDVGEVYLTGFPQMLDMPELPVNILLESALKNFRYLYGVVREKGIKVDAVMNNLFDKHCR